MEQTARGATDKDGADRWALQEAPRGAQGPLEHQPAPAAVRAPREVLPARGARPGQRECGDGEGATNAGANVPGGAPASGAIRSGLLLPAPLR